MYYNHICGTYFRVNCYGNAYCEEWSVQSCVQVVNFVPSFEGEGNFWGNILNYNYGGQTCFVKLT